MNESLSIQSLNGLFNDYVKHESSRQIQEHGYKETNSITFVRSSLKSHPLWVTLD